MALWQTSGWYCKMAKITFFFTKHNNIMYTMAKIIMHKINSENRSYLYLFVASFFFFLRQKEVPVQIKKRKLTVNSHIFSCTYTGAL